MSLVPWSTKRRWTIRKIEKDDCGNTLATTLTYHRYTTYKAAASMARALTKRDNTGCKGALDAPYIRYYPWETRA